MITHMGGAISFIISLAAVVAFTVKGAFVMATVSAIVSFVCLWSWLHMWYFARLLARQRIYVAALNHGEFAEGTPEAADFWKHAQIVVESRDIRDIPDWITRINMVAALVALALALYGTVTYFRS